MTQDTIEKLLAWGQYVHWADLQFLRFMTISEDASNADRIAIVSHWLASEYVVLEGWHQLCYTDIRIERLITLYPENCDVLRRCRNAVYHFQPRLLDKRIQTCIKGQNEELQWTAALHFEFQRFLLNYANGLDATRTEKDNLTESIIDCIGWSTTNIRIMSALKITKLCNEGMALVGDDTSQLAQNVRVAATSVLNKIDALDMEPLYHQLQRVQAAEQQDASSGHHASSALIINQ